MGYPVQKITQFSAVVDFITGMAGDYYYYYYYCLFWVHYHLHHHHQNRYQYQQQHFGHSKLIPHSWMFVSPSFPRLTYVFLPVVLIHSLNWECVYPSILIRVST
jgi:hypothetical protein